MYIPASSIENQQGFARQRLISLRRVLPGFCSAASDSGMPPRIGEPPACRIVSAERRPLDACTGRASANRIQEEIHTPLHFYILSFSSFRINSFCGIFGVRDAFPDAFLHPYIRKSAPGWKIISGAFSVFSRRKRPLGGLFRCGR